MLNHVALMVTKWSSRIKLETLPQINVSQIHMLLLCMISLDRNSIPRKTEWLASEYSRVTYPFDYKLMLDYVPHFKSNSVFDSFVCLISKRDEVRTSEQIRGVHVRKGRSTTKTICFL